MATYYYKTDDASVLAALREFDARRKEWNRKKALLETAIGGKVAITLAFGTFRVFGAQISDDAGIHWCRPVDGYRKLRAKAVPPKRAIREERASIKAAHEALIQTWKDNDPGDLNMLPVWDAIGVNGGNVAFSGGGFFVEGDTAYFRLGFPLDPDSDQKRAGGEAASGWIEGAVEITASEHEAALARAET